MSGDTDSRSPSQAEPPRRLALHAGLFLLSCVTTYLSGASLSGQHDVVHGLSFAGTLMGILAVHEMGHYLAARRHGLGVSLPYFLPLPPFISFGTMGAVIRMERTIEDRNQLLDVGAAGPLAGLVVAIPLLIVGLSLSTLTPGEPGTQLEGNSILYLGLKFLVFGRYLPAADGTDVLLHPMAFAAWVGLLLTMINLIPIGQLDGGHIARAFLGPTQRRVSRAVHWLLLVAAAGAFAFTAAEWAQGGRSLSESAGAAGGAALPWAVWFALLWILRSVSSTEHLGQERGGALSGRRVWLAWFVLLVFVLIFTPIPLREVAP